MRYRTNKPESREQLEELWRLKLTAAQQRYRDASAKWREAIEVQRQFPLPSPDGNYAVGRAAQAEALARREYMKVLKIYMDLVVRSKVPPSE